MKILLAALALAGAALSFAPKAEAAPVSPLTTAANFRGRVGIGVGIGIGGSYAPRPYWGVTGWQYQQQYVIAGYDAQGRPVYTVQTVSVPVYGWIYPRHTHYYPRPSVGIGLGFRFR